MVIPHLLTDDAHLIASLEIEQAFLLTMQFINNAWHDDPARFVTIAQLAILINPEVQPRAKHRSPFSPMKFTNQWFISMTCLVIIWLYTLQGKEEIAACE